MFVRALAVLLRPVARRVRIEGLSMVPTYGPGEYVWAVRRLRPLRVGDVVLGRDVGSIPGEIVKRVTRIEGRNLFLEGDNAGASVDSHQFGLVSESAIRWVIRPQRPALP